MIKPSLLPWAERRLYTSRWVCKKSLICATLGLAGKLAAAALSIIVQYELFSDQHTYTEITGNETFNTHSNNGNVLYGIEVFVDPEFATVGLTHAQAETQGYSAVTTYLQLDRIPKAHVMGEMLGGILLTAEQRTGRILGVQMLCPRAADIIHEATLAVRFGLTVMDIITTVHVYPSISDGLRQVALLNAKEQGLM